MGLNINKETTLYLQKTKSYLYVQQIILYLDPSITSKITNNKYEL